MLMIRTESIDWLRLINMTLLRKDWGKEHTIMTLADVRVTVLMVNFNFEDKRAYFKIKCHYIFNNKNQTKTTTMYYYMSNETPLEFKRRLKLSIKSLIDNCISNELKEIAKTKTTHKFYSYWDVNKEFIKKTEYKEQLEELENVPTGYYETCFEQLQGEIVDSLNEPRERFVSNYVRDNQLEHKYLYQLLEKIIKEITKNESDK